MDEPSTRRLGQTGSRISQAFAEVDISAFDFEARTRASPTAKVRSILSCAEMRRLKPGRSPIPARRQPISKSEAICSAKIPSQSSACAIVNYSACHFRRSRMCRGFSLCDPEVFLGQCSNNGATAHGNRTIGNRQIAPLLESRRRNSRNLMISNPGMIAQP